MPSPKPVAPKKPLLSWFRRSKAAETEAAAQAQAQDIAAPGAPRSSGARVRNCPCAPEPYRIAAALR